jgi:hypothetical protein
VSDAWQELRDKSFARFIALRDSGGYKPTPLPQELSKTIREMPNMFLGAIYQKNNFGRLD